LSNTGLVLNSQSVGEWQNKILFYLFVADDELKIKNFRSGIEFSTGRQMVKLDFFIFFSFKPSEDEIQT